MSLNPFLWFPAIVDWAEQVVDSIKQQLQTETLSRLGSEIETIIGTEVISFAQDNDEQPQAHGPGTSKNLDFTFHYDCDSHSFCHC